MSLNTLIELIKGIKETEVDICGDSNLYSDIGLSSLDMMILICKLESSSKKKISFEKLAEVKTVAELLNMFSQ